MKRTKLITRFPGNYLYTHWHTRWPLRKTKHFISSVFERRQCRKRHLTCCFSISFSSSGLVKFHCFPATLQQFYYFFFWLPRERKRRYCDVCDGISIGWNRHGTVEFTKLILMAIRNGFKCWWETLVDSVRRNDILLLPLVRPCVRIQRGQWCIHLVQVYSINWCAGVRWRNILYRHTTPGVKLKKKILQFPQHPS